MNSKSPIFFQTLICIHTIIRPITSNHNIIQQLLASITQPTIKDPFSLIRMVKKPQTPKLSQFYSRCLASIHRY